MSRKIYGVTVGTTINPKYLETKLKPVKTVNGVVPDENGNVQVSAEQIGAAPAGNYATEAFVTNKIAEAQLSGDGSDIDLSGFATKDDVENLSAEDVGARPSDWMPSATEVGATPIALSNMIVQQANNAPHKMYEVLKTYMANRHRLYYDTPGFVGYDYNEETGKFTPQTIKGRYNDNGEPMFPIVCSTIAWMAILGVGFENCRINTGTITDVNGVPQLSGGENIPYSGCKTVDLTEKEILDYWGLSGHGTVYAANMAKLFHDAGMLHEIKSTTFSEVLPGDLLFYDNYVDGSQSKEPFLRINHVEMFVGWSGYNMIGITTENNENQPSMIHTAWNIKNANDPLIKHLKYYVRIPCAGDSAAAQRIEKLSNELPFAYPNSTGLIIGTSKPLEKERAYPIIVKLTGIPNGTNVRLNVFPIVGGNYVSSYASTIFISANKAQNIAPNTYYTTFVAPETISGVIDGLRITAAADNDYSNLSIESVSVYDKLVPIG